VFLGSSSGKLKAAQLTASAASVPVDIAETVRRLEAIYIKLWFTLRYTVKYAFAIHKDVLEAGTFIQVDYSAAYCIRII